MYDVGLKLQHAQKQASRLSCATNVSELRSTEARVALAYWSVFQSILPESLGFRGRLNQTSHQYDAADPFNASLNFGYAMLESECRKSVNAIGLEPAIGFLHPIADYQVKEGLVFDTMEPFRSLVDMTALEAFECGLLELKDFFFTGNDFSYRFEPDAKRRFVEAIRRRFNSGVKYRGRQWRWDTIIQRKTQELAQFLMKKSSTLDFTEPTPSLERRNDSELRAKILSMSASQARQLGIGKSTLHYLRSNARGDRPFRICRKVIKRLG